MEQQYVAALGFFDGVHRGHRAVLQAAIDAARERGAATLSLTFDRHPAASIHGKSQELLCTISDRIAYLHEAGMERVEVLPFDDTLRHLSAGEFLEQVLFTRFSICYACAGFDYRFGYGGVGDAAYLQKVFAVRGLGCHIVEKQGDNEKYSSTRIRALLTAGKPEEAAEMLGRPFSFAAEVVHGKSIGHTIGFPTMNLPLPAELVRPAAGVYVCRVTIDSEMYTGICNIANGETSLCEVNVFGFAGDTYGKRVRCALLHYLRPMQRFADLNMLRMQLEKDRISAQIFMKDA